MAKIDKAEKNNQRGRRKSQMARAKEEKKAAKTAAKRVGKQGNRKTALDKALQAQRNVMGLPPVLWPFMLIVGYIWARNTWDKEQQARDLREAREFLKESRGFRI